MTKNCIICKTASIVKKKNTANQHHIPQKSITINKMLKF